MLSPEELERYARHIVLHEIGGPGQAALKRARVLVIGAGGLGSPVLLYLGTAGVGRLTIADHDTVDLTNLQRQIAHDTGSIGLPKVASARRRLQLINPQTRVDAIEERVAGERLEQLVSSADVVIDATDNFATRHAINRACVKFRKPLVSGAGIRFDGQIAVFDLRREDSPCYHCLFPEQGEVEEMRCAVMGVFAPLVGIVGSVQAAEALKLIIGIGESLSGRLLLLDALAMQWRSIRLNRDASCRVCATRP